MTPNNRRSLCLFGALLMTLAGGTAAIADDTELLVLRPGLLADDRPNILFIVDTSGSMDAHEAIQQDYDPDIGYAGLCDGDSLYWTTDPDATPDCSIGTAEIRKAAFFCDRATADLLATGAYVDRFVQYREFPEAGGDTQWARLDPNDPLGAVECQRDAGVHGQNVGGRDPFPRRGLNAPEWTADAAESLVWGAGLADTTYKVVDGNYLNWAANPPEIFRTRLEIVQGVTKDLVATIGNANVGLMRFNNDNGGRVVKAIEDVATGRAGVLAAIDSLTADGFTPLAETLYEAARYYRGLAVGFGDDGPGYDPAAVDESTAPPLYQGPAIGACSRNFAVVLTDGEPQEDRDVEALWSTLPDWAVATGRNGCTSAGEGACLPDVATYLANADLNGAEPGAPRVNTYTVGFLTDYPLLRRTADNGDGSYYTADDIQGLTNALGRVVNTISRQDVSFTAPVVPVNAFNRAQNLNEVYIGVFRPDNRLRWPGNLKKYRLVDGRIVDANGNEAVDPETGFFKQADPAARSLWSDVADGSVVELGGAANELPAPGARKLYTNLTGDANVDLTAPANYVSPVNAASFRPVDLGLTGAAGEPAKADLLAWALGEDVRDEDGNPLTTQRNQMGDPLHSRPAVVVYGADADAARTVAFIGTNEGYVHAIDGADGGELWAFLPREKLTDLARLYGNAKAADKHYGVDGNMQTVVIDENGNGVVDAATDRIYLVFGMRRGGGTYYAIDVTDPDAPKLAWRFADPRIAQSWSTPTVARVSVDGSGQAEHGTVLILGGGYDVAHDAPGAFGNATDAFGNALFMLDADDGSILWSAGNDVSHDLVLPAMTRAIPSDVTVADLNGDGRADRMYVGDMGGQLWRFDVFDGRAPAELVAGGVIATFGAESGAEGPAAERRFFVAPDIAIFRDPVQDRRFLSISLGSGYRSHPLDAQTEDRFYSVRDPNVFTRFEQAWYDGLDDTRIVTESTLADITGEPAGTILDPTEDGWMIRMRPGEKVLAESRTFDNRVFFTSFQPRLADFAECNPGGGINRLYEVSVVNGDPPPPQDAEVGDPDLEPGGPDAVPAAEARSRELQQEGIAPELLFVFPSPEDPENCVGRECSPEPVGCVGLECFRPGFENVPVRTFWTEDGVD
jgi:type IV pilus assembly protein PilY1